MATLTPHQRSTLIRLARRSILYHDAETSLRVIVHPFDPLIPVPSKWILAADCGGPAALEHLLRKGYVDRRIETGPRGGEHFLYRPNAEGWKIWDRHVETTRKENP